MVKAKKLKIKIILVLLIINMLLPYVPDYTPVAKAATSWDFNYTGGVQEITLDAGLYKLEVWGGSGGNGTQPHSENNLGNGAKGGLGGYSCRYYYFSQITKVYVVCGGMGQVGPPQYVLANGGYNGGGDGCPADGNR